MLRRIIKLDTTYINRANTNDVVFKTVNDAIEREGKRGKVISFTQVYKKLKLKRACKIISDPGSAIYKVTFDGNKLRKWVHANRRVGRPRQNWTEETIKELWDNIKESIAHYKYTAFDENNEGIMETLRKEAQTFH